MVQDGSDQSPQNARRHRRRAAGGSGARHGVRSGLLVAALTAAVVGAGLVVVHPWSDGDASDAVSRPTPVTSTPSEPTVATNGTAAPARLAGSALVAQAPRTARLPSGKVVPIRAVSTRTDGTLDVPKDIDKAGWWRGGARIGDPFGSTLVAAHIDSTTQGLGPFSTLLSVRPRQRVTVTTKDLTQEFEISSLRLIARSSLRKENRIFAVGGARRLTLVTCAPPYVKSRGGYQNLALVTAVPVRPPAKVVR